MNETASWATACEWMGTLADLQGASAVLEWDRETIMPSGAAEARGAQLSTLAGLHHRALLD
ncbi:MAG: carboxypeptidase M32, partial [Thermoleophilia bacterium]|nr:carboxypeptidase M32 [Thermoleophilia bacterium]